MKKYYPFIICCFMLFFACKKDNKNNTSDDNNPINIGNNYQGGIIFYVDGSGEHGLIAAASNQSNSQTWSNTTKVFTNATDIAVGKGMPNTATIISVQGSGTYAANICDQLALNGYTDWFLPSKNELTLLYQQKDAVGDFTDGYYWTSSEYDTSKAWYSYFPYGVQYIVSKDSIAKVRAIRAF